MAERRGKAHMVQVVADKSGITRKQAGAAVDAMLDAITEGVQGGSVSLPGLGTFSVVETKARTGVRPGTKDRIDIPAGRRLKFKASSSLKGRFGGGSDGGTASSAASSDETAAPAKRGRGRRAST